MLQLLQSALISDLSGNFLLQLQLTSPLVAYGLLVHLLEVHILRIHRPIYHKELLLRILKKIRSSVSMIQILRVHLLYKIRNIFNATTEALVTPTIVRIKSR